MRPVFNPMDELKKYNARIYVKAMMSAWLASQEYAGITREQAGKNFMSYIQEYGGDVSANDVIQIYELLKRILMDKE